MALPGVAGTAQGECGGVPCITVYVTRNTTEIIGQIPAEIEGFSAKNSTDAGLVYACIVAAVTSSVLPTGNFFSIKRAEPAADYTEFTKDTLRSSGIDVASLAFDVDAVN